MTGLLLLVVSGAWLLAAFKIAVGASRLIAAPSLRRLGGAIVFIGLAILPIADELIGGVQFRSLCKKNAVLNIAVENAVGRTTRYSSNAPNMLAPGTAVPIYQTDVKYTDVTTQELVASFTQYVVKGGLFIRTLGISENTSPLTISPSACSPELATGETISRTLRFNVSN